MIIHFLTLQEVWVMSSIALYTNSPRAFGHAKHECPAIFGIQINIGQNQQRLIVLQFNLLFQILQYISCVVLLDVSIMPNSRGHFALLLQLIKVLLDIVFLLALERVHLLIILYSKSLDASKVNLDH